jgi:hypothetical protein
MDLKINSSNQAITQIEDITGLQDELGAILGNIEGIADELTNKADIYTRLAQGITIGNNIKGCHITPQTPFIYYSDWSYLTAGNVKLVRTNNSLVYTNAANVDITLVTDGTVLVSEYVIEDEFYITDITGSPTNVDLIYRVFNLSDIDQRIGIISSLETEDKSSIINAINSLYDRVSDLLTSSELVGSPFASYTAFTQAYPTVQVGKYAYVTFTNFDAIPIE